MRLINADALKEKINTTFWSEIGAIIDNAPTIDAVEVVRCKDCKHCQNGHICAYYSRYGTIETSADDFCSHGDRRAEGEEE